MALQLALKEHFKYYLEMKSRVYVLNSKGIKTIAFQLAEKIEYLNGKRDEAAYSYLLKWLHLFWKRLVKEFPDVMKAISPKN